MNGLHQRSESTIEKLIVLGQRFIKFCDSKGVFVKGLMRALKGAEDKNIVVVGDLMLDEYVMGKVERISPEAPVPVLREVRREFSFGGAANVANNCKHVGFRVDVIGLLGDGDHVGDRLLSMLVEKKIFVEGVIRSADRITTRKKKDCSAAAATFAHRFGGSQGTDFDRARPFNL